MRAFSWVMVVLVIVAAVLTVGAAGFTYVNVRQFMAESPIEVNLPQFDMSAKPTKAQLFQSSTEQPSVTATAPAPQQTSAPQQTPAAGATAAANPTAAPAAAANTLRDPGRVTILLLGTDHRKGEKDPARTDTIIVLSLDPVRKTGAILSIPRDTYLPIPGTGRPDRINNANAIGEGIQYPGGGPALTVKAVQSLLGVPIQRYAMVDFDIFTTVIDALGPIQVCPKEKIHDDKYPDNNYGYITVDFPAGCQELASTKLLQYARVRHNAGDDFGRATRQQEVIRAVRDKVLSLGGVSTLLGKAGQIWGAVKDNLKTDLTFDEIVQLAQVAQNIPKENIQSVVITDKDGYLLPQKLPTGDEVMTPIYEKIHGLVENLFNAAPSAAQNTQASAEGATLAVSNGSGVDGMAKKTADLLREKGFNVLDVKNADLPGGYGRSIIRVYTGKVKTARYIVEVLKLDGTAIVAEKNGPPGIDIEVIVGKDLAQGG